MDRVGILFPPSIRHEQSSIRDEGICRGNRILLHWYRIWSPSAAVMKQLVRYSEVFCWVDCRLCGRLGSSNSFDIPS